MNSHSPFTVLIERSSWRRPVSVLLMLLIFLSGLLQSQIAAAGNAYGRTKKFAKDLQSALDAPLTPNVKWARNINGVRNVQMLITSTGADVDMTALRASIKSAGGSVHVRLGQRCGAPAQALYGSGNGYAANTFVKAISDVTAPNQRLITAGVVNGTLLTLSAWLVSAAGWC